MSLDHSTQPISDAYATSDAQRCLFITLSNIGDAIMTTPVLTHLHRYAPKARIDIVADPRSAEWFSHCPFRGEIHVLNKKLGWRGRWQLLKTLRRTQYDILVDLRTDVAGRLLRARRRLTKPRGAAQHEQHSVEQHAEVIRPLLPQFPALPLAAWLGAEEEAWAQAQLAHLSTRRCLALAPGANWPPKCWPPEQFIRLMEKLVDHYDSLILLGGPGDVGVCAQIATQAPLPVLNLAAQTSLLQAAAVLKHVTALLGNDSGLGHIAASVGTPTLTLFGPGNPTRYRPWGLLSRWLVAPDQDLAKLQPETVLKALRDLPHATR